jgi:hypothetical protein
VGIRLRESNLSCNPRRENHVPAQRRGHADRSISVLVSNPRLPNSCSHADSRFLANSFRLRPFDIPGSRLKFYNATNHNDARHAEPHQGMVSSTAGEKVEWAVRHSCILS